MAKTKAFAPLREQSNNISISYTEHWRPSTQNRTFFYEHFLSYGKETLSFEANDTCTHKQSTSKYNILEKTLGDYCRRSEKENAKSFFNFVIESSLRRGKKTSVGLFRHEGCLMSNFLNPELNFITTRTRWKQKLAMLS